jgi:hypothetical protein
MSSPDLTVPARFAGPPGSANGGWFAGRLAELSGLDGPVQVTLREPPPLEVGLDVRTEAGVTTAAFGGALIAEAQAGTLTEVVDPVDHATAQAATARYAGRTAHPFPGCFVCGPDRPAPDGLGLRPGRLADRPDTVATPWLPDRSLAGADGRLPAHLVWAALDCPGGWSSDLTGRPMVLGRMTVAVDAVPLPGEPCVVLGRRLGDEGRKTFTASTAYDSDGRVLGRGRGRLDRPSDTRTVIRCDPPGRDVAWSVHGREVVRTLEYLSDA